MTAMRAPGIFSFTRRRPRIVPRTATDTSRVSTSVWLGMSLMVSTNLSMVLPVTPVMPNMPPTWPMATWMPTPVRKPMSTLLDRKLAMNPRRRMRAVMSSRAAIRAAKDAIST